jgi:hypothetical protein
MLHHNPAKTRAACLTSRAKQNNRRKIKMKAKRTLTLALILAMLLALTACGVKNPPATETAVPSKDTVGIAEDLSAAYSNINNIVNLGHAAGTEDYIYYSYGEPGLFRMRHDGSGKVKLCEDTALYLNIADGWIYYWETGADKGIYKIRTNGEQRTAIKSGHFENVIVYENRIYCLCRQSLGEDCDLLRMNLDGTGVESLLERENILSFVISFGKIYLTAVIAEGYAVQLYRINLDGSMDDYDDTGDALDSVYATEDPEFPILYRSTSWHINYYNGYVYYYNSGYNGEFFRLHLGEVDREKIPVDAEMYFLNVVGDKVFYFGTDRLPAYYFMADVNSGNVTPLIELPTDYNYSSELSEEAVFVVPKSSSYPSLQDMAGEYDIPFTIFGADYHFWDHYHGLIDFSDILRACIVFYGSNAEVMAAANRGEIDVACIPVEYFEALPNKADYRLLEDTT